MRRSCGSGSDAYPTPFTPAAAGPGYRYDISLLQAEFSLTQCLDLPALREVRLGVSRRLLDVQRISCDPIAAEIRDRVCRPVVSRGQRAPALRFEHPVTQALLGALVVLRLLPLGFSNRDLRELLAPLLGQPLSAMTQGRMSYHIRRLRLHGLIDRLVHRPPVSAPWSGGI